MLLALLLALPAAFAQPKLLDVEALRALELDTVRAGVPASYSRGFRRHAREVGDDAGDALAFYADALGLQRSIRVAVLDAADWSRVSPLPYGLPFVTEGVAVLPAAGGILADDFAALPIDAARRARLEGAAGSLDAAIARFVDVIAYHEIGHELVDAHGLSLPTRWLEEFVSSYFAYAFLRARHPEHAVVFDELSQAKVDAHQPTHRSLAEFEELYVGVGPSDYAWYQCRFQRQVQVVYEARGMAFLTDLRAAFPRGAAPASAEEVLTRLDAAAPGLGAWVEAFPVARAATPE